MAKYTPLMRLRKARKPKISAANPGTSSPRSKVSGRLWKGCQKSGNSSTRFQTMKSGNVLPYTPLVPVLSSMCMPMA